MVYSETTEHITVSVRPLFLQTESNVFERKFMFAYFIRIENNGTERIQVLRRHWIISHGTGKIEEVEGEGIVGKQPVIFPNQAHEYNSFCILETLEGFMEGTYTVQRADGTHLEIKIPRFTLRAFSN
ncbi:MAG: Co2+/Mg2+ efflux protein ApaG [Bacteroidetes bacterium]|nr:Co2+/Mg2+ efflux protein ApaG [Bacteroidota bacterium]